MDSSGPSQLTRIAGPGRGPGVALAAAAVFLVLAILKPWGAIPGFETTGSRGVGGRGQAAASDGAAPSPSPTQDPLVDLERHCPQPSGWRVFAHELWSGGNVRSWKSLTPAREASGPLDPTIPLVPVTSQQVPLLGYCAPWQGPDRPPGIGTISVWRITPDGQVAVPVRLQRVFPAQATVLGALYAAPSVAGAPPIRGLGAIESWPAGVYVFEMTDGEGFQRWWKVEVIITPPRPPVATPAESTPG
ncbi:MAG TPA: hypothetical protein VEO91_03920 [Candidatus Limnocylindria bacterium]|nr:hypothetical protein [Candidatus Limnocylindria bacterium]